MGPNIDGLVMAGKQWLCGLAAWVVPNSVPWCYELIIMKESRCFINFSYESWANLLGSKRRISFSLCSGFGRSLLDLVSRCGSEYFCFSCSFCCWLLDFVPGFLEFYTSSLKSLFSSGGCIVGSLGNFLTRMLESLLGLLCGTMGSRLKLLRGVLNVVLSTVRCGLDIGSEVVEHYFRPLCDISSSGCKDRSSIPGYQVWVWLDNVLLVFSGKH